jgi:hypothetical protein
MASVDNKNPTGASSKIKMLPALLGGSSTDSDGSAFSTLNPGDHIKKSSLVTQNNV